MQYAQETFLSRYYRLTRNWRFFAQSLEFPLLEEVVAPLKDTDLGVIQLPPWVEHPDLGKLNPIYWQEQANVLLHQESSTLKQLIKEADLKQDEGNAILACILHAAFSVNRKEMAPVFEKLKLPIDSEGYPPASSYLTVSTLIKFHRTEAAVLEVVKQDFTPKQLTLFRYYLYAINVQIKPKYAFLAPQGRGSNCN
ncbi:hypothetical protein [Microseira sp. BLCC-F43]|jgi:hypothetical protein|uniref:hypothetical protein n=1 Tax=Microseira sp. BLCC-F43 TaxID=3153602 RepID=UPI0035B92F36